MYEKHRLAIDDCITKAEDILAIKFMLILGPYGACLNDKFFILRNNETSRSHGTTKLQGSDLTNHLFLKLLFIIIIIVVVIIISYNKSRQLYK